MGHCDTTLPYNIIMHPFRKANIPGYNVYFVSSVESLKKLKNVKKSKNILDGFIISEILACALEC